MKRTNLPPPPLWISISGMVYNKLSRNQNVSIREIAKSFDMSYWSVYQVILYMESQGLIRREHPVKSNKSKKIDSRARIIVGYGKLQDAEKLMRTCYNLTKFSELFGE
jgi:transposase